MTAQLAPLPIFRAWDNNGNPLVGGQLFSYAAGTTTPQATFIDSTQTTQNTNPVILNSRGEANLWLNPVQSYKLVLQDGGGHPIWAVDNINGGIFPSGSIIPSQDNTFTLGSPSASWANVYIGPAHVPVLDSTTGNILYYARTAAEIAAAVTPVAFTYPPFDIRRYGGDPTGVASSDTAMTSVIAVCGTAGGTIRCPRGTYLFNNQINLNNATGITIQGDGAETVSGTPPTTLLFSNTGSVNFITAASSNGCGLRNLYVAPSSTAYSGNLVILGHAPPNNSDAAFFSMQDCTMGFSSNQAANCLNLDKSINCYFQRVSFVGGSTQVKGQASAGGSYSNVVAFRDCQFSGSATTPVVWCGESWTFDDCTFEGATGGIGLAIQAISTTICRGMSVRGCWFGDSTAGGGTWITFWGNGLSVIGNRFGGFATGTICISLNNANGVDIRGNSFDTFNTAISFDTAPVTATSFQDNFFTGVTNQIGGTNQPLTLQFNPNQPLVNPAGGLGIGQFSSPGYEISPNGIIRQWGSLSVTTGTPSSVSFPKVFPNGLFVITAGVTTPSGGGNTAFVTSTSASGFTANVAGTAGASLFNWQAIGN